MVVIIIGMLAGAAVYYIGNNIDVANRSRVQTDFKTIQSQLNLYEGLNGFLPTSEQGLTALVMRPTSDPVPQNWSQLLTQLPPDPWNKSYHYVYPGVNNPSGYDLFTSGKDRLPNTADDIGNWTQNKVVGNL